MSKEAMKQALEALKNNRRKHYGCEDTWYSCPKHEDGCYNEHAGSECNCGADEANVEIDAAIKVLQEAQQEPVAHAVIAGALFDFMGWLTSRKERLLLSSSDDASPVVVVITEFAKMRGLSLEDAKVTDWNAT